MICKPTAKKRTGAILLAAIILAGCGQREPTRYELQGSVSWQGKPVPRGYVVFSPDAKKGSSGPGTQAEIVDGRYKTPPGRGVVGGPHVITATGFDGVSYTDGPVTNPNGKLLFSEEKLELDLPLAPGEQNLAFPAPGEKTP